ncbi:MAG: hypothetical protein NC936_03070, partial [Candidatus Omnitrophica bacterium]|nr:hypothetical protein [Candidatus Omnitrophota bacterium]
MTPVNIIKYLKNIFSYKELIFILAIKEFKIRYKSAVLGFSWTLLNPLLIMVIVSMVFALILKIQIEKFPIFLLTALIPWYFLSSS